MPIDNNSIRGMDIHLWELLQSYPGTTAAGMSNTGDGQRFIYCLLSATSFWRFDSWGNCWQQLANPPGGSFGAATHLLHDETFGSQVGAGPGSQVWGSVWAFISSGTGAPSLYRYNVATNTWSGALSVAAPLPATFGTVARLVRPSHHDNNWESGITGESTVTASGTAAAGATSISVNALAEAIPAGAILNFGTQAVPKYAVLTALANAGATSIAVSGLIAQVTAGDTARYYGHLWLWGNNATAGYRYNIAANTWNTTNVAGAAIAASPAALGADGGVFFLPGITPNTVAMVRAAATASVFSYDLTTNAWTSPTVAPATESFTTGSAFAAFRRPTSTKNDRILGHRSATVNFYAMDPVSGLILPFSSQFQFAQSTASAQDRLVVLATPDDPTVQFLYASFTNSSVWARTLIAYDPFLPPAI